MNELELRDIHLPDASLWWPLAPGWWVAAALLLVLGLLTPWLIRRLRYKPVKRLSLGELETIRDGFHSGQVKHDVIKNTAALLRRTLIAYRGREGFAASTGNAWTAQLQELVAGEKFSQAQLQLLGRHRYQRDSDCDIDELLQACERWMRALPRSESHVSD